MLATLLIGFFVLVLFFLVIAPRLDKCRGCGRSWSALQRILPGEYVGSWTAGAFHEDLVRVKVHVRCIICGHTEVRNDFLIRPLG